jgi:hypothetical protein
MDSNTVPTSPAPGQPREHERDAFTETIPLSRIITTRLGAEGITFAIVTPHESELNGSVYSVRVHADGSACGSKCKGTEPATATVIPLGEVVTVGRWQWYGGACALVGWYRFDSNPAGKALRKRADEIAEDLAGEKTLHDLTRADLVSAQKRRSTLRQSLRRARKAADHAEHRYGIALQAAWAGWSVAIVLVAHLIESVI